jgi:hypothetical protein
MPKSQKNCRRINCGNDADPRKEVFQPSLVVGENCGLHRGN